VLLDEIDGLFGLAVVVDAVGPVDRAGDEVDLLADRRGVRVEEAERVRAPVLLDGLVDELRQLRGASGPFSTLS